MQEAMTFSHAGDVGDLLYALPTMRQLANDQPFDVVLYPTVGVVREPWTDSKFQNVRWLLQDQPYVNKVTFEPQPRGVVIDDWRKRGYRHKLNLADMVADAFKVPHWPRGKPWIEAPAEATYPGVDILLHRSPRYHDDGFPWRELLDNCRRRVAFVGGCDEWENFCDEFGVVVPLYPTPTLWDLAKALAGCKLFVGNQSSPRALAEALAVPVYVEMPKSPANTHYQRKRAWYGRADLGAVLNFIRQ